MCVSLRQKEKQGFIIQYQVSAGKILENNVPVFVITFATQEILLFRNAKTREVKIGGVDKVERCMYAAVITRVEEELGNELTGGWKVIEVCCWSSVDAHFANDHCQMARRSAKAYL
jgi:import inner membrane translocase subunit TIM44